MTISSAQAMELMPVVRGTAKRMLWRFREYTDVIGIDDLEQHGWSAVLSANVAHDPARGASLKTLAARIVHNRLIDYLRYLERRVTTVSASQMKKSEKNPFSAVCANAVDSPGD